MASYKFSLNHVGMVLKFIHSLVCCIELNEWLNSCCTTKHTCFILHTEWDQMLQQAREWKEDTKV